MKKFGFFFFVLSFCISAPAFQIGDHKTITHQAFTEMEKCFPQAGARLNVEWLVSGDVDEDLDLFTKWLFFSHYYNPHKHLDMRRADSSARIADLTPEVRRASSSTPVDAGDVARLGHIIHHFQDMAVPPHVVPVSHALWDGFESFRVHR